MFQILESQSRYEIQQQLLLNPNGLVNNTTNRFGSVDASGNVSSIKSVSHPNFGESVQQGVLIGQPNLIVDHFGTGKNAILFNGTSDYLIKNNTSFTPDWDEEFWIAGKFKSNGSSSKIISSCGNPVVGGRGLRTQFASDNSFVILLSAQNNAFKFKKTVSTYNDNIEHTYIAHWKGTDNVSNSEIYIDGTPQLSTTTSTGSFIGSSLYNLIDPINLLIGVRNDTASGTYWNQYLGKHIFGLGTPNVPVITNSLNSAI